MAPETFRGVVKEKAEELDRRGLRVVVAQTAIDSELGTQRGVLLGLGPVNGGRESAVSPRHREVHIFGASTAPDDGSVSHDRLVVDTSGDDARPVHGDEIADPREGISFGPAGRVMVRIVLDDCFEEIELARATPLLDPA